MVFGVFLVQPPMASVLLSALVERCFVSRMRDFFHHLSGSTFFVVVKNTYQKAANLMFCLISPVAKTPARFLEGQSSLAIIMTINHASILFLP